MVLFCEIVNLLIWKIIAVVKATFAAAKKSLDLYDTGAALYLLSLQANWEQVVKLVRYKLVKDDDEVVIEYIKIILMRNCGVKNYMKEDHPVTDATFCSCKKKAWKNAGLYGIRTLDLLLRVLFWFIT